MFVERVMSQDVRCVVKTSAEDENADVFVGVVVSDDSSMGEVFDSTVTPALGVYFREKSSTNNILFRLRTKNLRSCRSRELLIRLR